MPGTQIKSSVLNELQRQLNYELGAAHAYQALAVRCKDQYFDGFAAFFQKQVIEERQRPENKER